MLLLSMKLTVGKYFSQILLRNFNHFEGFRQSYLTSSPFRAIRPFASEVFDLPTMISKHKQRRTYLVKLWEYFKCQINLASGSSKYGSSGLLLGQKIEILKPTLAAPQTQGCRKQGTGGLFPSPDFDRLVNPIATRGGGSPPNYFMPPLIFRPTSEILSGKNARAWISMVLYFKKMNENQNIEKNGSGLDVAC